jgi:hypothetical protein
LGRRSTDLPFEMGEEWIRIIFKLDTISNFLQIRAMRLGRTSTDLPFEMGEE